MHTVEDTRRELTAERLDLVDIPALLLCHGQQPGVKLRNRHRVDSLEDHDACHGARALAWRGTTVAIGGVEVAHRRAAGQVIQQLALRNNRDRLRGCAFVIDLVGPYNLASVKAALERIVDNAQHLRQHTGLEAGLVGAGGAGGRTHLRPLGFNVRNEEAVEDVGRGIA